MVGMSPSGPCLNSGFTGFQRDTGNLNNLSLPPCPDPVTGKPAVKPPPSPRDAAFQAWYWETTLPDPTLATSPPNGAITGLDLYLAIGGPQNLTFDIPALGYMVHLEVSSVWWRRSPTG